MSGNDPLFDEDGNYSDYTLETLGPLARQQFTVYRCVAVKGEPLAGMWAQAKQQAAREGKQPLMVEGTRIGGYKILAPKGFRKGAIGINGRYEIMTEREFLTILADRLEVEA
jgi:hypothetical protein